MSLGAAVTLDDLRTWISLRDKDHTVPRLEDITPIGHAGLYPFLVVLIRLRLL